MRNNWWLFSLVRLRAAPVNDLDEGVFKRRLCLTWLRLQHAMNRKRKNVGHLISLQSTRHIPTAAEVEQPEPRSEGHAESFNRFHQVLHHLFFVSACCFMHEVGECRLGSFAKTGQMSSTRFFCSGIKSLNIEHCIGNFLFFYGDSSYKTWCACKTHRAGKKGLCRLLTVFMSMLMLVCEGVWLSEGEQALGEEEAWTRPVCRARHRCHVLIIKCHLMLLVSPHHRHSGSLSALMVCLKRRANGVRMHYFVCQD